MATQRVKPAVRREMIIEAARGVILERGLNHAGLRDIAAASGVSIGTVTYHFSSITEIITAVVEREAHRVYSAAIEHADAEPDPVRGLILLIDPLFSERDSMREQWRLWPDFWRAMAHRPGLTADLESRIRVWEACAVRVIERGVSSGRFPRVDAAEVALKLAAYSDGIGVQLTQRARGLDERTARAWLLEFLDDQLGAGAAPFTRADESA